MRANWRAGALFLLARQNGPMIGALSGGSEQDAGTMYPMLMQDTNGNEVTIAYNTGVGATTANSSARISAITDLRGQFNFTYDWFLHLSQIRATLTTPQIYNFNIAPNQPLSDPFSSSSFGSTGILQSLTQVGTNLTTSFITNGSGEMTQMNTPYGGHLRWTYGQFTYVGSRTQREVQWRSISTSAGAAETNTQLSGEPTDSSRSFHYWMTVSGDGVAPTQKAWWFQTDNTQLNYGLVTAFEFRPNYWPSIAGSRHEDYTWTLSSSNNPYISAVLTTEDDYNPTSVQKKTTQTIDAHGNLTQMQVYDYGNLTGAARTYTNTYLTDTNYTSRYIFNRLVSSTVTDGTRSATLSQITYDEHCCSDPTAGPPQQPPMTMHDSTYGTLLPYRGDPSTIITPGGTSTRSYDIGGNVASSTTNGLTTSNTTASGSYYAVPTAITTGTLTNNINWTPFLGLSSESGPNGDSASINYDSNARPSYSYAPTGARTDYIYADNQSPPMTIATVSGTGINSHWTRTTKDGFGRTIKAETGSGTGSTTATATSVVDTVYGPCGCTPMGKMQKVSQPHAPGATSVVWTTYNYDGLGRTTSVVAPDGSTTSYSYSGRTVTVTDPAGNSKTFTMDAFGNLTQVQDASGTTTYTYDILNHLTQVSMPPQTRTFNYTSGTTVGTLLLSATNPENGLVQYTYNLDHTLAMKTDAKGTQFTYTYDGYKRLLTVSANGTVLRTYTYDTNTIDSSYTQYSQGRLTTITYPAINYNVNLSQPQGSTTFTDMFTYDAPGHVTGKRLRVNKVQPYLNGTNNTQTAQGDLNLTYSYNYQGQMTSVGYPDGTSYTYSFDTMQRPSGMNQGASVVVNGVSYGPASELLSMSYLGYNETRQYNSMLQLTRLTIPGQIDVQYNFTGGGNNGKIASQTDYISGETVTYAYDALNRLISASGSGWGQTQSYDGFGNLVNRTGTGTAQSTTISTPADAATNRLSGYGYDANGNLLSVGNQYDAENRLVQANMPGGIVEYFYDGQNKRVWQGNFTSTCGDWCLVSDSVSFFGADGKLVGTYTPTAQWGNTPTQTPLPLTFNVVAERVYFGSKLIGTMDWSGTLSAVALDRLGSRGKYYPYGEERNSPQLANDQVKFATYTRDSATGLDYADQRYYASTFGRFMTPDLYIASAGPGVPSSWNRYSYVEGDPINLHDRHGLASDPPCGGGDCLVEDSGNSGDGSGVGPGVPCLLDGLTIDCNTALSLIQASSSPPKTTSSTGCYSIGGFTICLGSIPPPPPPSTPPSPNSLELCELMEAAYIGAYLSSYGSPLASWAMNIVTASDAAGLDDRFIVALAGIETSYGKNLTWGTNNAFNNGHTNYATFGDAIASVINLIGFDPRYTPYQSTRDIYAVYETGNINKTSSRQSTLDQIYGNQLGGNVGNVRSPRCP